MWSYFVRVFLQVSFCIDSCGWSLSSGNDVELQVPLTFLRATLSVMYLMWCILRYLEVTQPDGVWESADWYKHQTLSLFFCKWITEKESIFCIALTFKAPHDVCILYFQTWREIPLCMSLINRVLDQTRFFQLNYGKSDMTYKNSHEDAINCSVLVPLPLAVCWWLYLDGCNVSMGVSRKE